MKSLLQRLYGNGHSVPVTAALATTAGGAPPAADLDPSGWSAKFHSVRFRVVAAMLGMMLAGLVSAGLIAFIVQFQDSDARVDQAILDKGNSLVKLVHTLNNQLPGLTGRPVSGILITGTAQCAPVPGAGRPGPGTAFRCWDEPGKLFAPHALDGVGLQEVEVPA